MTASVKVGQKIKAYCSLCSGERNCKVLGFHAQEGNDGDFYLWCTRWYILRCRGCEYVFAQTIATNSEDYRDYYDGNGREAREDVETISTWPARYKRAVPSWFVNFSVKTDLQGTDALNASLKELYAALNADLVVLASIGIRTTFDIASELLGVDPSLTFSEKVNKLISGNNLHVSDKESIMTLVNAGSASAHRGWTPELSSLITLITVLEDFIYGSIVIPSEKRIRAKHLESIENGLPPRKPQSKPTKASK